MCICLQRTIISDTGSDHSLHGNSPAWALTRYAYLHQPGQLQVPSLAAALILTQAVRCTLAHVLRVPEGSV